MQIKQKHILLTGATGGLGQALALELAFRGARLSLVGRDIAKLEALSRHLSGTGVPVHLFQADLCQPNAAQQLMQQVSVKAGDIDLLINNAGVLDFIELQQQSDERIQEVIQTNVTALIQLTKAVLPHFLFRNSGHFVFIGSIFGSLGFPHYATYCASKFAVHGFSQSLRRELVDTDIDVTYIAPRAIETPMNNDRMTQMLRKVGQAIDKPDYVARRIVQGIEAESEEVFIGQPQTFFAWLNGVCPKLVNLGLKQQARAAREFLR